MFKTEQICEPTGQDSRVTYSSESGVLEDQDWERWLLRRAISDSFWFMTSWIMALWTILPRVKAPLILPVYFMPSLVWIPGDAQCTTYYHFGFVLYEFEALLQCWWSRQFYLFDPTCFLLVLPSLPSSSFFFLFFLIKIPTGAVILFWYKLSVIISN